MLLTLDSSRSRNQSTFDGSFARRSTPTTLTPVWTSPRAMPSCSSRRRSAASLSAELVRRAQHDDAVEVAERAAERLQQRGPHLADELASDHHLDARAPAEVVEQRRVALACGRSVCPRRARSERLELDVLAHDGDEREVGAGRLERPADDVRRAVVAAEHHEADPAPAQLARRQDRIRGVAELLLVLQPCVRVVALAIGLAHVRAQRVAQLLARRGDELLVADRDAEQQPDDERDEDGCQRQRVIAKVEHSGGDQVLIQARARPRP